MAMCIFFPELVEVVLIDIVCFLDVHKEDF